MARSVKDLSGISLFLLHGVSFALVVFYVNMFQFWAWLSKALGPGMLVKTLPVIVTLAVLLFILWRFMERVNRGHKIDLLFLGLGIVGTFLALAIPDPHVPIKRIHVAEYIILSFLVRSTLSYRLQGASLTLFTFLVTMLLGVHDEMLQGFHSLRYYGWRDIIVNGTAGLSGALLGHGLFSFERSPAKQNSSGGSGIGKLFVLYFLYVLLFAATAWQVYSLYQQRGSTFSPLAFLPLAGTCLLIMVAYPKTVFDSRQHHGFQAVFWLALGLLVYPLLANFTGLEFI